MVSGESWADIQRLEREAKQQAAQFLGKAAVILVGFWALSQFFGE
jgi:hypothetical protein